MNLKRKAREENKIWTRSKIQPQNWRNWGSLNKTIIKTIDQSDIEL